MKNVRQVHFEPSFNPSERREEELVLPVGLFPLYCEFTDSLVLWMEEHQNVMEAKHRFRLVETYASVTDEEQHVGLFRKNGDIWHVYMMRIP